MAHKVFCVLSGGLVQEVVIWLVLLPKCQESLDNNYINTSLHLAYICATKGCSNLGAYCIRFGLCMNQDEYVGDSYMLTLSEEQQYIIFITIDERQAATFFFLVMYYNKTIGIRLIQELLCISQFQA